VHYVIRDIVSRLIVAGRNGGRNGYKEQGGFKYRTFVMHQNVDAWYEEFLLIDVKPEQILQSYGMREHTALLL
jgi:hypothetical protein